MLRLFPVVLATIAFVAFGWSNFHRVSLNFVLRETEAPLIFLLLISFASGALVVLIHSTVREAERRAEARKVRASVMRRAEMQELEAE